MGASLYDQFHTNVNGTAPLSDAKTALDNQMQTYEQVRDNLTQALGNIKATYTGNAADAMSDAFAPLSDSFNDGANFAGSAGLAVDLQIGNFATAQAKITKPVAVPSAPFYEDIDPFNTAHDDAVNKNAQIDSANEAAYNTYGADTSSAAGWLEPVPQDTSGFGTFAVTDGGSGTVVGAPPSGGGTAGSGGGGGSTGPTPQQPVGQSPGRMAHAPHVVFKPAPNSPPGQAPVGGSPTGPELPLPGTVLSSAPTDPTPPGTAPIGENGPGTTEGLGAGAAGGVFGGGGSGGLAGGFGSGSPSGRSLSGGSVSGDDAADLGRGGLGTGGRVGGTAVEDAGLGGRPGATGQAGAGGTGRGGRPEDDAEHRPRPT